MKKTPEIRKNVPIGYTIRSNDFGNGLPECYMTGPIPLGTENITAMRPGKFKYSRRRGTIEMARQRRAIAAKLLARGYGVSAIAITMGIPRGTADSYVQRIRREADRVVRESVISIIRSEDSYRQLKDVSELAMTQAKSGIESGKDDKAPAYLDRVISSEKTILDKLGHVREAGPSGISINFIGQIPGTQEVRLGEVIEVPVVVMDTGNGGSDGDGGDSDGSGSG